MPRIFTDEIMVEFDVVTGESINRSGSLTSSPVEDNTTVADNFALSPYTISISGICTNDAPNKLSNLTKLFEQPSLCIYEGRSIDENCVMTSFNSTHDGDIAGGFKFSISLQLVKLSHTREFQFPTSLSKAEQTGNINSTGNNGVSQAISKPTDITSIVAMINGAGRSIKTYSQGGAYAASAS